MLKLLCLKEILDKDEKYILKIEVPKSLYPFFKNIFDNLDEITRNLGYKTRLAEELYNDKRKVQEAELHQRNKEIKAEMNRLYTAIFSKTQSEREALKAVTRKYPDYWWLRDEIKKEVEKKRNLKIRKLKLKGLKSREIAKEVGVHPGTVRKILKNKKEKGNVEPDRRLYQLS